jgi:hypothetical protein
MSGSAPQQPQPAGPEVRIDRLVLDIPGLDPAQGRALALGIAEGLAKAGADGKHDAIAVPLATMHGVPPDLAARIVAALMQRLA